MSASGPLISVAFCTYNGERFLREQLASIGRQTRPPDELIICDDRSTDRTEEIVRAFAQTVTFPVVFTVNERNLGSTKNFEQAIRRCKGDLIVLSDQDDIWSERRLQRSEEELSRHPDAVLVFSDAEIIDERGRAVGKTLWESFHFNAKRRAELRRGNYDLYVKSRFVTGATVMFRRALIQHLVPAGTDWFHDEWLVALCPFFGEIRPIEEQLLRYRQHGSQQIGPAVRRSRWTKIQLWWWLATDATVADANHWSHMRRRKAATDQLCAAVGGLKREDRHRAPTLAYRQYQEYLALRLSLPAARSRRFGLICAHLKWYFRFGGWESVMKDLLLVSPKVTKPRLKKR